MNCIPMLLFPTRGHCVSFRKVESCYICLSVNILKAAACAWGSSAQPFYHPTPCFRPSRWFIREMRAGCKSGRRSALRSYSSMSLSTCRVHWKRLIPTQSLWFVAPSVRKVMRFVVLRWGKEYKDENSVQSMGKELLLQRKLGFRIQSTVVHTVCVCV